jgi:hypothetical protein
LRILIISAKHGILCQNDVIEPYDEVLKRPLNSEFADKVASQLERILPPEVGRVLVLAPQIYVAHLPEGVLKSKCSEFQEFSGRLGKCQSELLKWLGIKHTGNNRMPVTLGPLAPFATPFDPVMLSEVFDSITPARSSLNGVIQWYARLHNQEVPAKKLASALTGIPVSSFETCHALALLQRNGIEVCRAEPK